MAHSTGANSTLFTCALNPQYTFDIVQNIPEGITIVICIVCVISTLVSVAMNLFIMIAIAFTPRLHTPTFILLGNLALTDFTIGFTMGPLNVLYILMKSSGQQHYELICNIFKAFSLLGIFLGSSSLFTLTSISYDRYLSIQMRVKYHTVVTKNRAYYTMVSMWFASLVGPMFMAVLSKRSFMILMFCIQVFCLIIIVDCYRLSFDLIKTRQREIKMSIKKTSKGYSETRLDSRVSGTKIRRNKPPKKTRRREEEIQEDKLRDIEMNSRGLPRNKERNDNSQSRCTALSNDGAFGTMVDDPEAQNSSMFKNESQEEEEDQNCSSKMKNATSTKKETEKVMEMESDSRDDRKTSIKTNRRRTFGSRTHRRRDVTNSKASQRRPCSLLADIEQFRKSLYTILFIVVALFLCYLPLLVVNFLVNLRVMTSNVWYNLSVVFVHFHSCASPVILFIRIRSIRKACGVLLRNACQ